MSTTTTTPGYTAWHRRPGGTWEVYCHAVTERAAWDRLLDLTEPGDKTVTRTGRRPQDRLRQGSLFA